MFAHVFFGGHNSSPSEAKVPTLPLPWALEMRHDMQKLSFEKVTFTVSCGGDFSQTILIKEVDLKQNVQPDGNTSIDKNH